MGPAAYQSRREMAQLSKLHLQLPFEGARPGRKDIEDQTDAIDHPALERMFQVPFLSWTQRVREKNDLRFRLYNRVADLLDFSAPNEKPWIWRATAPADNLYRNCARGDGKLKKLVFGSGRAIIIKGDFNQNRGGRNPRCSVRTIKKLGSGRQRLFFVHALVRPRNFHIPRWDHGGNGVFVDHLTDGVLEQDDELIKGFDLTL